MKVKNIIRFNGKALKTIVSIVLFVIIAILSISLIAHLVKKVESKTKIVMPQYIVGELSSSGEYKESEEKIFTKNLIECSGLKTTLSFNHNVKYEIFFYDESENYLSRTGLLEENYNQAPEIAKYCRVVIEPKEDDQIKWYEVLKYSRQVKIEINKVQKYGNLFKFEKNDSVYDLTLNSLNSTQPVTGNSISSVIDTGSYGIVRIYAKENVDFILHKANNTKAIVNSTTNSDDLDTESIILLNSTDTIGDYVIYEVTLTNTDRYIAFTTSNNANICVFGISR